MLDPAAVHSDDVASALASIERFRLESRRLGEADGLRSNEVRVIYSVSNRVWVGTYGGGLQSIEADGRVGLMDFGMIGRLDEPMQDGLTRLFVSLARGDAERVLDELLETKHLSISKARFVERRDACGTVPDLWSRA